METQDAVGAVIADNTAPPSETTPPPQGDTPSTGAPDTPQVEESEEEKNRRALEATRERQSRRSESAEGRIRELTAQRYAEQARADAALRELERVRGSGMVPQHHMRQQGEGDPEPRRDDPKYLDYDDYVRDLGRWQGRQAAREFIAEREQQWTQQREAEQVRATLQNLTAQHGERVDKYVQAHPEFKEVFESDAPVHPIASLLILRSLDSPQILAELHRDPGALDRLNRSNPFDMAAQIYALAQTARTRTPQVSNAPAPGNPVRSQPSSSSDEPPSDPNKYRAWADKHLR